MEKRYQVFISSTFDDLKEERQAVLRAILELDHMPAGMELFPASDDDAWDLIKDVIDASDYYVLIIGGRYGSQDDVGLGYTEKEYGYAVETQKPVIPLLHKNPDNITRDKTSTDPEAWKKLAAFRAKVEANHTCAYWLTAEELKSKVIVGVTKETKRHPAIGWVRADKVPSSAAVEDILALRERVAELEEEAKESRTGPPADAEDLLQGEEPFEFEISFVAGKRGEWHTENDLKYNLTISPTWDEIFAAIAPSLIDEAKEALLRSGFSAFFTAHVSDATREQLSKDERFVRSSEASKEDLDTCIVQLRALGLIEEGAKKRTVKDTQNYWKLTRYGDHRMVQLRALRRSIENELVAEDQDVASDQPESEERKEPGT